LPIGDAYTAQVRAPPAKPAAAAAAAGAGSAAVVVRGAVGVGAAGGARVRPRVPLREPGPRAGDERQPGPHRRPRGAGRARVRPGLPGVVGGGQV
jgi:hypothetical protein